MEIFKLDHIVKNKFNPLVIFLQSRWKLIHFRSAGGYLYILLKPFISVLQTDIESLTATDTVSKNKF